MNYESDRIREDYYFVIDKVVNMDKVEEFNRHLQKIHFGIIEEDTCYRTKTMDEFYSEVIEYGNCALEKVIEDEKQLKNVFNSVSSDEYRQSTTWDYDRQQLRQMESELMSGQVTHERLDEMKLGLVFISGRASTGLGEEYRNRQNLCSKLYDFVDKKNE